MTAPSLSTPGGRSAGWLGRFYESTIGRKIVMAVTGLILVGFLVVHMAGNLLVYRGAEAINGYAEFLKSNLVLLWGARITLLGAVVLHAHAALTLARRARAARPAGYQSLTRQVSSWSARLMRWGGILLVVFIVLHLLHFTTGQVLPSRFVGGEVYQNVVRSFRSGWVVAFYLVAMAAVGLHLHHGLWSMFQTLGANHPHWARPRRVVAWFLSFALTVGFVSVPLAVFLGWVG
ncbi:MAG: succinate dehydrogenase cytochrome b subunit [Gemmatimonadales bacterium]